MTSTSLIKVLKAAKKEVVLFFFSIFFRIMRRYGKCRATLKLFKDSHDLADRPT